jgi:hypothetical protein
MEREEGLYDREESRAHHTSSEKRGARKLQLWYQEGLVSWRTLLSREMVEKVSTEWG